MQLDGVSAPVVFFVWMDSCSDVLVYFEAIEGRLIPSGWILEIFKQVKNSVCFCFVDKSGGSGGACEPWLAIARHVFEVATPAAFESGNPSMDISVIFYPFCGYDPMQSPAFKDLILDHGTHHSISHGLNFD